MVATIGCGKGIRSISIETKELVAELNNFKVYKSGDEFSIPLENYSYAEYWASRFKNNLKGQVQLIGRIAVPFRYGGKTQTTSTCSYIKKDWLWIRSEDSEHGEKFNRQFTPLEYEGRAFEALLRISSLPHLDEILEEGFMLVSKR